MVPPVEETQNVEVTTAPKNEVEKSEQFTWQPVTGVIKEWGLTYDTKVIDHEFSYLYNPVRNMGCHPNCTIGLVSHIYFRVDNLPASESKWQGCALPGITEYLVDPVA